MGKAMRVLIVEDELSQRMLMQRYLRDMGFCHADVAVNGLEAVEAYTAALGENDPYRLIFLDIEMPEMGGQDALQRIRDMEKARGVPAGAEVKALMTTAHDDQRNVVKAFFEGFASGYLVKPVERQALTKAMMGLGML